jgi:hypothetical protein
LPSQRSSVLASSSHIVSDRSVQPVRLDELHRANESAQSRSKLREDAGRTTCATLPLHDTLEPRSKS